MSLLFICCSVYVVVHYNLTKKEHAMSPLAYQYRPPFLEVKYYGYFLLSEITQINKAFSVAWVAHYKTQPRMNGLPYITHPVAMTHIAMDELNIYDSELNITIILHDTDEPSVIPFLNQGIHLHFGLSNAENNQLLTKTDANKALYIETIILSKKWRVLLTKLIDRLHNMRTLENSTVAFQQKQAKETREFFLPLCNELSKIIPKKYEAVPPKIFIELTNLCEQYGC